MTDWAQLCVIWALRGGVLLAAGVLVLAVCWPARGNMRKGKGK